MLKYNYKSVHSGTGFTPIEAEKQHHHFHVKFNMERQRANTRKYPDIEVGDFVRVHNHKDKLDKERISTWSKNSYEIEDILEDRGQTFYKTTAPHHNKLYLRHELLKV